MYFVFLVTVYFKLVSSLPVKVRLWKSQKTSVTSSDSQTLKTHTTPGAGYDRAALVEMVALPGIRSWETSIRVAASLYSLFSRSFKGLIGCTFTFFSGPGGVTK